MTYGAHLHYAGHTRIRSLTVFAAPSSFSKEESPMPASQTKKLRLLMKKQRTLFFQECFDAGEKITANFFDFFDFPPQTLIGGYWPMGSELDVRSLLNKLIEKGFKCALPSLTPEGLLFRLWTPSTHLERGLFQILEPPSTAPLVLPDVLLVPLLAFDKYGHRLGYGQGHFDRYLHQYKVLTIGVGFKGQEIEKIPHQPHDFALDYI